ncbi:DUF1330 domain-containing protein [Xanthobacteraceae bacterium A53D]
MAGESTPKGYWVARVDVTDVDAYAPYTRANGPPIAAHGGRFIVRGGDFTAMEGGARSRNVVVEFPSFDAALAAYRDPAYQAAVDLRRPYSNADLIVLEGVPTPPTDAASGKVPGYWLVRVSVRDPERYKAYAALATEAMAAFGGTPLARGGRFEIVEGTARGRNVVSRFADVETALACYRSETYQRALAIRQEISEADLLIISGYDGPQPG